MVRELKYVIIIGFSRTGTTSLYNYLADHPEINVAKRKELNFFNSINRNLAFTSEELRAQFDSKFLGDTGVKIDATPAYISCKSNLELMNSILGPSKYRAVILVRNRFDRINSWFNYAKKKGILHSSDRIEDVILNKTDKVSQAALDLFRQEHALNFYASVIEMIQTVIPLENIIIIRNGDLNNNAHGTLSGLARSIGISDEFYSNYHYKAYNQSKKNKLFYIWLSFKKRLRKSYSPNYIRFMGRYLKKLTSPELKKRDNDKLISNLELEYNKEFEHDEFKLQTKFNNLFLNEN